MKNIKRNAILLLLITFVVLFFILKDDFPSIVSTLASINIGWILIACVFAFLYYCLRSASIYMLTKKCFKHIEFKKIFRLTMITQFFNGITPFASGGQPMAIYMLKKNGAKIGVATNIILQDFILYQFALVTYGVIAVLLNTKFQLIDVNPILKTFIIVGFIINIFVALALVLLSISNKLNKRLLRFAIKILSKFKIIKNKEQTQEKYSNSLDNFYQNAIFLRAHKSLLVKSYLYNFLSLTCYYIVPVFILFSMGDFVSINVFESIVGSAYVYITAAFVPMPGSTGGIEVSFISFFGSLIGGARLGSELLIWRFITYYFALIIGAIIFISMSKEGEIEK